MLSPEGGVGLTRRASGGARRAGAVRRFEPRFAVREDGMKQYNGVGLVYGGCRRGAWRFQTWPAYRLAMSGRATRGVAAPVYKLARGLMVSRRGVL